MIKQPLRMDSGMSRLDPPLSKLIELAESDTERDTEHTEHEMTPSMKISIVSPEFAARRNVIRKVL
jgi:hypothetical protein